MARFYLHICCPNRSLEDDDGYEFPDAEAARKEAIEFARELMAEALKSGRPMGRNYYFRIVDDCGQTVAEVPFAEAVPAEA